MAAAQQQTSILQIVERARAYQPPAFLPPDHDAASAATYAMADVWALQLACGEIDLDTVYAMAKVAAMNLQVHTQGRCRWKDTKPFLEWLVETTAARMDAFFEVEDDRAMRQLRATALAAVNQGHTADAVRHAIASQAVGMRSLPPETLLHEAYAWAVAEARRNARWMMTREAPGP